MIQKSGIHKIRPSHKDYSFLHTFGATQFDVSTLPDNFSIYDGRTIPNQDLPDTRFSPALPALPEGCVAETTTFIAGLEDGATALYDPNDFYLAIPPGTSGIGRDIRDGLQTAIDRGFKSQDGSVGNKRTAYFNVYGAGAIDDFDAARIAVWINQVERRGVSIGTWWYGEFENPSADGSLPVPSFNTTNATLHNHLITGWRTNNGVIELEDISWQGMDYANAGKDYINREIFNSLINQPNTAMFTLTKVPQGTIPVPLGPQVYIDELVAFIRQLFGLDYSGIGTQLNLWQRFNNALDSFLWAIIKGDMPMPSVSPPPIPPLPSNMESLHAIYNAAKSCLGQHITLDSAVPAEVGCVEAVSYVLKKAGFTLPKEGIPAVKELLAWLPLNGFEEVTVPTAGCIIAARNPDPSVSNDFAHVGIVLDYGIASNTSSNGIFAENYSMQNWLSYFSIHGSTTRYFQPK